MTRHGKSNGRGTLGVEKRGYQPFNEGYQPTSRGYRPAGSTGQGTLPPPPKGGSGQSGIVAASGARPTPGSKNSGSDK